MIRKINRLECIKHYPKIPLRNFNETEEEYEFYFAEVLTGYVLTLPSKSFKGHIKLLGEELTSLIMKYGCDKLLFLGDLDIAWLHRVNYFKQLPDDRHATEGFQYLRDNKIGKRFNGALEVDAGQLGGFIKHLAWLVRTNGILSYVHFIDPGQNFIGDICQYGNLHVYTFNEKADKQLKEIIEGSKFDYVKDLNCYNKFSKTGAIKERRMTYR